MIGQSKLLQELLERKAKNTLPIFSILVGPEGSGKKTLCETLCKQLHLDIRFCENKMEDLRELVEQAYKEQSPIMYVIKNGDTMAVNAKNSILKLTEEPPVNAYIVLLANNIENILPTLISRGAIFQMQSYTTDELIEYGRTLELKDEEITPMLNYCYIPGDFNRTVESIKDRVAFVDFVNYLIDNIGTATLSNVLKVSKKVKTSQDGEGYDLTIFLQCLRSCLANKCKGTKNRDFVSKYLSWMELVSKVLKELTFVSLNKSMLVDEVIIGGWQILCNYGN